MKHRKKLRSQTANVVSEDENEDIKSRSNYFKMSILLLLCIVFGWLNYAHVSFMQEGNIMFSHLSNLERELSFRTEMGFYYSFYKQVLNAPDFGRMVHVLMNDNLTEYPDTINALQRFNIYPELMVGIMYRYFVAIASDLGITTRTCYMVNRGDLPAVQSCEGLGEPAIFYVTIVLLLNGAMMGFLFLIGYVVSERSVMGAVVTCALYLFNHRECTRVQWTPPLRESFSFPFLIMQQFFLVVILKKPDYKQVSLITKIGFVATTLISLLCWQFAQFGLLTQCIATFLAYVVAGNNSKRITTTKIFIFLIFADLANLVLQFGNTLLLTGPLRPCLIMACLITAFEPAVFRNRFQNSLWTPVRWIVLLALLLSSTAVLKCVIGLVLQIKSDNHMFDIIRSKFSNFSSFDSLLYTCAAEFDFYDMASIKELCLTGLLPLAACSMSIIVLYTIYKWIQFFSNTHPDHSINQISISGFCEVNEFYLLFQAIAYITMAGLIMRLKLFATPHLCIMGSLICHRKWPLHKYSHALTTALFNPSRSAVAAAVCKHFRNWPIMLILAACSVKGVQNLMAEWRIHGSYSNWDQEQLVTFIMGNTGPGDSFTGQMGTMATLRLVTGRPIIIHPHYEDEALRNRVHSAYSVYSRKSIREVWLLLRSSLQAKFLVYEHRHCHLSASKPGCSYTEMWDIEDPGNADKSPLCIMFEEYVRGMRDNRVSQMALALSTYFKWRFTTASLSYSLFEIVDVPQ